MEPTIAGCFCLLRSRLLVRHETRRLPVLRKIFSDLARRLSYFLAAFAEGNDPAPHCSREEKPSQPAGNHHTFIEEAFRNSERRFRSIWESSSEAMRLTDSKGTVL